MPDIQGGNSVWKHAQCAYIHISASLRYGACANRYALRKIKDVDLQVEKIIDYLKTQS